MFLQNLNIQVINLEQGLEMIRPGYRAIAKWVKVRMIKEIYARI